MPFKLRKRPRTQVKEKRTILELQISGRGLKKPRGFPLFWLDIITEMSLLQPQARLHLAFETEIFGFSIIKGVSSNFFVLLADF